MSTASYRMEDLATIEPLARLAVILAAAGDHSVLLLGRPGVGATMLARRVGMRESYAALLNALAWRRLLTEGSANNGR